MANGIQEHSRRSSADRWLFLRVNDEIDGELYKTKNSALQAEIERLKPRVDVEDKDRAELSEIAVKAFELSQALKEKWFSADVPTKRQLRDIVCLDFLLHGLTLVPPISKPFHLLAKRVEIENGRGERI